MSRGDVVLYEWQGFAAVGKVDMLASVTLGDEHGAFAYISAYDHVLTRARDERVRPSGAQRMVLLHEITSSLIWSQEANGHVVVLRPWGQR